MLMLLSRVRTKLTGWASVPRSARTDPHTQGIDQQVEGYAEHDGQGQALLAKQGQGHGEAH